MEKIIFNDDVLYCLSSRIESDSFYKVDVNTKIKNTILHNVIAFDIYNNKIYFAENGGYRNCRICESNLNGGNIRILKDQINYVKDIKCENNELLYLAKKNESIMFYEYIENKISLDNV